MFTSLFSRLSVFKQRKLGKEGEKEKKIYGFHFTTVRFANSHEETYSISTSLYSLGIKMSWTKINGQTENHKIKHRE